MTKTLTFLNMIAAKIMKNYKNIQKITKNTNNDKNTDIFEYDCRENNEQFLKKYKKLTKITKSLTFLNMIAAKIMNNYEQLPNMIKVLTFFDVLLMLMPMPKRCLIYAVYRISRGQHFNREP